MKQKKTIFPDWLIGILLTLLISGGFFLEWHPLRLLEYKAYDLMTKLRQHNVSSPVVIVTIDDTSIASIGRWPWPRVYIAEMIGLLSGYGAKIIGVNILYTEPDLNSGLLEIRALKKEVESFPKYLTNAHLSGIYNLLGEAEQRLDSDTKLTAAIDVAKNVILPLYFTISNQLSSPESNMPEHLKKNSKEAPYGSYINAAEAAVPIQEFVSGSLALGHINLNADEDGTIRREPLFIQYKGRIFPSFALHAVMKYLNYGMSDINIPNGLMIGKINIPADREERMFNKAVAVYEHVLKAGNFKDVRERIKRLKTAGETMIFGTAGAKKEATILMEGAETRPTLGRYEIQKELGRGAMGTVFLGKDLSAVSSSGNKLSIKEVLRIIAAVADGLDYAQSRGIVHRDIKPSNIMLLKGGEVKITDFGIARVIATSKTQTGVILGTPSYMSPEQVLGKKVDGRSDLFSLGVVFFELLTGVKPFQGDSIATLMFNIANTPHVSPKELLPNVPDCCVYIADKLLAKDIEERYQRGRDVVNKINSCMGKMG